MNIPSTLKSYLAKSQGRFKARQITAGDSFEQSVALAGVAPHQVVKPVLLKSGKAYLMAIVRADQILDLAKLSELFQRVFEPCSEADIERLLPDCAMQALPPLPAAFGLRAIMDKSILELETVYFNAGVEGLFLRTGGGTFRGLQEKSWSAHSIAAAEVTLSDATRARMRREVEKVDDLPTMPGLATELIRIRNNPYAHANELAAVIEQDPSLSAQVLRYARVHQPQVNSVEQAILRVLGMDFVLDVAFGLALGRAFNNPKEGPLGLDNFWRHSVYCAALTQNLCNAIESPRRPPVGMAYLAGLLHNFGMLLLGHMFPAQFERLNRAVAANPGRSILELERETIGISHTELGLWLMDAWDMPKEVVRAVTEHHNPEHEGDFSTYANLVFIANALLKRHGIGEGVSVAIPRTLLDRYGLSDEQLEVALGTVMQGREELEFVAAKMAA